jgi:hypothetical protein
MRQGFEPLADERFERIKQLSFLRRLGEAQCLASSQEIGIRTTDV